MDKRITLVVGGLVLLGVAVWLLLPAPSRTPASSPAVTESSTSPPEAGSMSSYDTARAAADDARRARTAAAFAELQASRKALQQNLGELKSRLWGRELPAERARTISRDMLAAQYLLKNPALLGAFSDADGVYAEKSRVDASIVRMREISAALEEPTAP